MTILSEVRPGAYFDSVILMQLQRSLADLPGVIDAGVVMATPANKELLAASGLAVESSAGSDDLLIVVKAKDKKMAGDALSQVDGLLASRRRGVTQEFRPHSLDVAVQQLPEAQWALISVPGRYAAGVARNAFPTDSQYGSEAIGIVHRCTHDDRTRRADTALVPGNPKTPSAVARQMRILGLRPGIG